MLELYGKGVSDGIAIGKLAFYSKSSDNVPKYSVTDTTAELKRYKNAGKAAKRHLMSLYEEACKHLSKSESVIFQTHIMILEERINDLIGDICHITIHDIDEDYNAHITMEKGEMIK